MTSSLPHDYQKKMYELLEEQNASTFTWLWNGLRMSGFFFQYIVVVVPFLYRFDSAYLLMSVAFNVNFCQRKISRQNKTIIGLLFSILPSHVLLWV